MLVTDTLALDASNTTDYSTKSTLRGRELLSYHYEWDGDLAATVTLQRSNKPDPGESDSDWVDDTGITPTPPAGTPGKAGGDVPNTGFVWYRLKFARTGGAGTVRVWVNHVAARS